MNVLREVRKVNEKSMPVRIALLLAFCVIFMITTYAWFDINKEVNLGGLEGDVTSWDTSYYMNDNEVLDETATLSIDSLYPGMPSYVNESFVRIYNKGDAKTQIDCQIVSVKLFGEEVLDEIDIMVSDVGDDGGKRYTIFSEDTQYPFNISIEYNRNYLEGKYTEDNPIESAQGIVSFNASWTYKTESEEKDDLDTQYGEEAYEYYEKGGDPSKAIEVKLKVTSSRADI